MYGAKKAGKETIHAFRSRRQGERNGTRSKGGNYSWKTSQKEPGNRPADQNPKKLPRKRLAAGTQWPKRLRSAQISRKKLKKTWKLAASCPLQKTQVWENGFSLKRQFLVHTAKRRGEFSGCRINRKRTKKYQVGSEEPVRNAGMEPILRGDRWKKGTVRGTSVRRPAHAGREYLLTTKKREYRGKKGQPVSRKGWKTTIWGT